MAGYLFHLVGWFNSNDIMVLLLAIIVICFEAVAEGLIKRYSPAVSAVLFKWWVQWLIAAGLFVLWFLWALQSDIPIWKLITGFVFVRFLIFDYVWNLSRGVKLNYYGTTKLYDRIMTSLGSWGHFMKFVLGVVGIVFLLGIE